MWKSKKICSTCVTLDSIKAMLTGTFAPYKRQKIAELIEESWVLYMSSDRFLWALESCDLSQTDKSII